jgi:two-component system response regulator YesN
MEHLKEEYFTYLISSPVKDVKSMREKLKYLCVELDTLDFKVMVFSIGDFEILYRSYPPKDFNLLMFAIINVIEETMLGFCRSFIFKDEAFKCVVFKSGIAEITVIMNIKAECEALSDKTYDAAQVCRERLNKYLGFPVSIGIGRFYSEPWDIHISYKEALRAVQNRLVAGKSGVTDIEDIGACCEYPYGLLDELMQQVKAGEGVKADEAYRAFFEELYSKNVEFPQIIKRLLIQLVFILGVSPDSGQLDRLEACQGIDEIKCGIGELVGRACEGHNK